MKDLITELLSLSITAQKTKSKRKLHTVRLRAGIVRSKLGIKPVKK